METATTFKIASTPDEFEQVHRLNYRTFVEEIPQHEPNPDGRYVDRFHDENTYIVGIRGCRVIAQIAVRRRRPFSLDAKLPDLDRWLPSARNVVELRLLAVEPAFRNGPVPAQLLQFTAQHCVDRGDEVAIISGAVRRLRLYRALGFVPFGPVVGTSEAPFQPMILTFENYMAAMRSRRSLQTNGGFLAIPPEQKLINLLPGPVAVSPMVLKAASRTPVPHRAPEFVSALGGVRRRLAALVHAKDVQVMPGSGSLANDVIAAQLSGRRDSGLVLSSGEFGERIADHARRAGLDFRWERLGWGVAVTRRVLTEAIGNCDRKPGWLWLVHHETSTGVLHDLDMLKEVSREHGLLLCLDCISSIGAVGVNLEGVHLASGVSGKGLASLPGLALVFHQDVPAPRVDLPRYLDLSMWASSEGVPFTHSSNLIMALDVALAEVERLDRGRCEPSDGAVWLRGELRSAGFELGAEEAHASPIIVTVKIPSPLSAGAVGAFLEERGFLTSFRSGYLAHRNWLQFCLMTSPKRSVMEALVAAFRTAVSEAGREVAGPTGCAPAAVNGSAEPAVAQEAYV